jgi:hypothetical protein
MIGTSEEKEFPGVSILRKLSRHNSKERRWRFTLTGAFFQPEIN